MHDLLRAYAAEQPEPDDGAVRRLFGWYVRTAAAARMALVPQSPPIPVCGVPAGGREFPDARLRQAHALFDELGDAESAAEARELLAAV